MYYFISFNWKRLLFYYFVRRNYKRFKSLFRLYYFSFFCAHLVAMSSTICNMILYGWLNENIATHVRRNLTLKMNSNPQADL